MLQRQRNHFMAIRTFKYKSDKAIFLKNKTDLRRPSGACIINKTFNLIERVAKEAVIPCRRGCKTLKF